MLSRLLKMGDIVPVTAEVQRPENTAPPANKRGRAADAFRALRHRNFQLFISGQFISLIGTWMQMVALAWLIYRLTGSSLLLGTLGFVGQFPIFLLSPLAGLVADRWPRRYVIMATQASSMVLAGALAALTLSGVIRVWEVLVLETMLGVVNAFDVPARQAFLIEMVGREDLLNAIALNSSMFNGARVAGPAIAGILVALLGEGWCFFANAVSYIAVIAGLKMIRIERVPSTEPHASPMEKLREGYRFVRHTAPIRTLLLLVALVSLVALPFTVLMPIFADRILHGGASAYGMLMGAIGVGAVIGAMTLATRRELRGLGSMVAYASMGFGASLILFAFSRWFWVSLIILVPAGVAMMTEFAATNTLIQAMVPDRLRGRAMSLYAMMFLGMAPLGSLAAGAIAARIGAPLTVAIGGTACLIGGAVFARAWPAMRSSARELLAAQGMMYSGEPPDPSAPPS
jgi:MFS family permease